MTAEPSEERAGSGSLAERVGAAARSGLGAARRRLAGRRESAPAGAGEWWLAAALAGLIAAGPLLTLAGAALLAGRVEAENKRLAVEAAPRIAAARVLHEAREELAALARRPTLGATLEALARALPPDASLARVERDAVGRLAADIATPDPDRLRAALRREPTLAGLRDAGQRQGEGTMIVSLAEPPR